jgi:hypothetical protein
MTTGALILLPHLLPPHRHRSISRKSSARSAAALAPLHAAVLAHEQAVKSVPALRLLRQAGSRLRASVHSFLEQNMNMFDQIADAVIRRGDLAHLALFVWASGASALLAMTLRDLFAANRRFDAFVRELTLFNRRHSGDSQ